MYVFFRPDNQEDAVCILVVFVLLVVVYCLVRRIQCGTD